MEVKNEFDKFIEKNGSLIIVGHSSNKIHCDCWDPTTDEGDTKCHKCLGTGWHYNWFKTHARRNKSSMSSNEVKHNKAVKISANSYSYYLKSDIEINSSDIIIEYSSDYKKTEKLIVTNNNVERGQNSQESYYTINANIIKINSQITDKKLVEFLKNKTLKVV